MQELVQTQLRDDIVNLLVVSALGNRPPLQNLGIPVHFKNNYPVLKQF